MPERERDSAEDAPLPGGAPPGGLDAAEPSGEGDPANERELEQATQRPDAFEGEPEHAVEPAPDPRPKAGEPADGGADESGGGASDGGGASEGGGASDGGGASTGSGASEGGAGAAADALAEARRERDEYLALAQRTQADFENYRKRAARDSAAAGERAKANLVRELLSVVDNLERALAAGNRDADSLRDGVQLVHGELTGVLARAGIESYDPAGEPFDPTLHEALSTRQQEGAGPGVVVDVVEKGYRINGAVLRPARVVVSG